MVAGTFAVVVALGGAFGGLLVGCRPQLTEARIIEDLGDDELVLRFWTVPERPESERHCIARSDLTSVDEARDAAVVAGWIERECKDDPVAMRLTAEGRRRSAKWRHSSPTPHKDEPTSWFVTVARYERSGWPTIRPGKSSEERWVTIPGRWIPNDDGQTLYDSEWKTIRAVNREETFVYWDGVWARRHLGR